MSVEPSPPPVVFVDDDLVVVDKPSGMPSVPARTTADPPDVGRMLEPRYGFLEAVHRLDRDTSGLLVLARSRRARAVVGRSFEAGAVAKRYLAVVQGVLPAARGELCLPLAGDRDRPPRQRVDPILGRRATTRWRLLATGTWHGAGVALVELEPVTGRGHQLRVHLAWLGCPVAGDRLYGSEKAATAALALHAAAIALPHPRDGRRLSLARLPADAEPWRTLDPAGAWRVESWTAGQGCEAEHVP